VIILQREELAMFKPFAVALSAVVAVSLAAPEPADAQQRGARAKKERKVMRDAPRPHSVGANGLCQRDTGTPNDKLDFRNRCDVEEFWSRINGQSDSPR
jgi:hypothetical protein